MIALPRSTPNISAPHGLSQVSKWAFSDNENTQEILNKIIACRTNPSPSLLVLSSGYVYGGSLTHRYNDPITIHEVLANIRLNILSHIYQSSDTLLEYARGKKDFTMHFQDMFLMGATILHLFCNTGEHWKKRHTLHAHVTCTSCTKELDDVPVTLGQATISYPSYQNYKLLFTKVSVSERWLIHRLRNVA